MRISDWSSDVCSSDLPLHVTAEPCCYHDLVCVVRAVRFLDNLCQELPLGCFWQAVKYTKLALDRFQADDWFSFLQKARIQLAFADSAGFQFKIFQLAGVYPARPIGTDTV